MRLRSSRPQGGGVGGRQRVTAEPSPYGAPRRSTGMPPPTSTFVDALTGYLQAGRKTRGYLALFAIVVCFGLIAASVLRFFVEQYDEMRQRAMDRPALIERRPVDAGDLDYYSLHAFYDNYYRSQTSIKLVRDHGVTRLLVTNRKGDVLLKRRLVPSDLDHQRILARHADKTGDVADTVDLYYKDGQAMLVVKSSDFDL
ncbi:MAG: hypothetical protein ACUVTZ_08620 [Armatimonadota bacterium]